MVLVRALLGTCTDMYPPIEAPAHAASATTHVYFRPQSDPERPPGADLPPKEVCNLDPMAPRSRQKRQLPEALQ